MRVAANRNDEQLIRQQAISWIRAVSDDGSRALESKEIGEFAFNGRRIPLKGQQGIWNPKGFSAALSVRTSFTPEGKLAPYPDRVEKDGLVRYSWYKSDGSHGFNVALRNAMAQQVPVIWFYEVAESLFSTMAPVYVIAEEPQEKRFVLAFSADDEPIAPVEHPSVLEESLKRYLRVQTKIRLHQPVFRSTVLTAYKNQCAVCKLGHAQLLDAAHIVPDREDLGIASVVNGMALCKIHHAAFDNYFLGIRPDHIVEIRHDLLMEVDGPMLRHGLQDLHGRALMALPNSEADWPREDLLENAYDKFRKATVEDVA